MKALIIVEVDDIDKDEVEEIESRLAEGNPTKYHRLGDILGESLLTDTTSTYAPNNGEHNLTASNVGTKKQVLVSFNINNIRRNELLVVLMKTEKIPF